MSGRLAEVLLTSWPRTFREIMEIGLLGKTESTRSYRAPSLCVWLNACEENGRVGRVRCWRKV